MFRRECASSCLFLTARLYTVALNVLRRLKPFYVRQRGQGYVRTNFFVILLISTAASDTRLSVTKPAFPFFRHTQHYGCRDGCSLCGRFLDVLRIRGKPLNLTDYTFAKYLGFGFEFTSYVASLIAWLRVWSIPITGSGSERAWKKLSNSSCCVERPHERFCLVTGGRKQGGGKRIRSTIDAVQDQGARDNPNPTWRTLFPRVYPAHPRLSPRIGIIRAAFRLGDYFTERGLLSRPKLEAPLSNPRHVGRRGNSVGNSPILTCQRFCRKLTPVLWWQRWRFGCVCTDQQHRSGVATSNIYMQLRKGSLRIVECDNTLLNMKSVEGGRGGLRFTSRGVCPCYNDGVWPHFSRQGV